nr:hypothetical protein [Tanacetum cinerariifolium]
TLKQKNVALEDEKESLSWRVTELESLVSIKDRELKDVDAIVTSFKSQNDGLADQMRALEISSSGLQEKVSVYENYMEQLEKFQDDQMKLAVVICMNYPGYLFVLSAAISKAIEKGMQDGLSLGITHGKEGRSLADVAAHNPSAEANYVAALQRLQSTEVTSNVVPAVVHTIIALSMTFASASTIPLITIEDYEFIGTGGPEGAQGSGEVASFP